MARFEITSFTFMLVWVPRTGLPNAQREMRVEFSGDHLVGRGDDQLGLFVVQFAEVVVYERGRLLQHRPSL